ncbi:MAG: hypothetical protein J5526_07410 [Bacteroidales bacterium]|nr:hypothetical protein [Bacteroidales bacterium]
MEKLIEILKQFDTNRNEFKGVWDENAVAACFQPCAKEILSNGYFLINGTYIIELGSIELYYHEEYGDIKDYIMYHTNDRLPKKYKEVIDNPQKFPNIFNAIIEHKGYPYFKIGTFNQHQSGVDVTFEKEKEKEKDSYRASFLIRSYRVLKAKDGKYPIGDKTKYDHCSTHIFDDLFYEGINWKNSNTERNSNIEWINDEKKDASFDLKGRPRTNVAEYIACNEKETHIEKGGRSITSEDYLAEVNKKKEDKSYTPKYIKIGKSYYKQDMRLWQFRLHNIE